MIRGRYNPASASADSPVVRDFPDVSRTSPAAWLAESVAKLREGSEHAVFVLLTGAADLVGFRIRVAQSRARADMLPSCFDHAALLCADPRGSLVAYHVPLRHLSVNACARTNGIRREENIEALAPRWRHTPNLALMRFPVDSASEVEAAAQDLVHSRLSDDFLTPLSAWLAFVWGVQGSNPLVDSVSIPSAAFVETCFSTARQDVTPGITTRVVTPESIWQARFWPDQYREPPSADPGSAPSSGTPRLGYYVLQQPAASVSWPSADRHPSR